jgi:flagellar hook-length control protein FliK
MVTAVTGGVMELTGKTVGTAGSADQTAVDHGESGFAQLLGGLVVQAPATPVAPTINPLADKAATTDKDALSADQQINVSADMLALCGLPLTPQPQPQIQSQPQSQPQLGAAPLQQINSPQVPVLIASVSRPAAAAGGTGITTATDAESARQATTTATATSPEATPTAMQVAQQAADTQDSGATKLVDVQWLQSMTNVLSKPGRSGATAVQNAVSATLATDDSGAAAVKPLPGHDLDANAPQNLFQLLAQAAPMPALLSTTSSTEHKSSEEAPITASTDAAGASITPQLQSSATSIASDAAVLDAQSRHVLHSPVGSHQWATELGNKLTLLAGHETRSATLYMNPADLGPVQVRIDMNQNQDQASVWFTAEHADTRSALEQSLPRLREMFSAQGMSLTDAGVFGNRSGQQQTPSGQPQPFGGIGLAGDESLADTSMIRSISLNTLDAYA